MDIKGKIGTRIKDLRLKRKLSQEKFSHLCELDRTYIASIENGKRNVSIVNIQKIAEALGVSLAEFFKGL